MEINRSRQTLGRGIAGISSKKISREQCMLSVDFETGEVEIETLGKNPMASKKPGMSVWEALDSGKRRDLTSQDKFMLFTPDAMLREGVEDETAFVFTLKVSKNPLRQVFNADQTEPPYRRLPSSNQEAAVALAALRLTRTRGGLFFI